MHWENDAMESTMNRNEGEVYSDVDKCDMQSIA